MFSSLLYNIFVFIQVFTISLKSEIYLDFLQKCNQLAGCNFDIYLNISDNNPIEMYILYGIFISV